MILEWQARVSINTERGVLNLAGTTTNWLRLDGRAPFRCSHPWVLDYLKAQGIPSVVWMVPLEALAIGVPPVPTKDDVFILLHSFGQGRVLWPFPREG